MSIPPIQITEQTNKRKTNTVLTGLVGAACGMGVRYVAPTKKEFSSLFNKEAVDSYIASGAASARAQSRSALKYAGVGALALIALSAIKNIFSPKEAQKITYSKYEALLDSSVDAWYACYAE